MSTMQGHYVSLAENYDSIWSDPSWSRYVPWMNHQIATRLAVSAGERVADIGAGTGIFTQELRDHVSDTSPMLCVDPSAAMMDRIPDSPRVRKICASVEDLVHGRVALPYQALDAVLSKETMHHADDLEEAFRCLGKLLAPGGRFLVVTLPKRLDYPLFAAAHHRYSDRQPEPAEMAAAMAAAGLDVEVTYDQFPVACGRAHYLSRVDRRFLSILSTFTEEEFQRGFAELTEAHPEDTYVFVERRAFLLGRKIE